MNRPRRAPLAMSLRAASVAAFAVLLVAASLTTHAMAAKAASGHAGRLGADGKLPDLGVTVPFLILQGSLFYVQPSAPGDAPS